MKQFKRVKKPGVWDGKLIFICMCMGAFISLSVEALTVALGIAWEGILVMFMLWCMLLWCAQEFGYDKGEEYYEEIKQ
jgi:hypothetical protein